MTNALLALAFITGFLLVFGLNLLLADVAKERRQRLADRLEEEARLRQQERARESLAHQDLSELATDGDLDLGPRLTGWQRLCQVVEQSGLRLQPKQLITVCVAAALLPSVPLAVLSGKWYVGLMVAIACGLAPLAYVLWKRSQRREKILSQLPDAFELISRVMRAGQTLPQGLQEVAKECSRPVAEEFGYCYEQQNLGLSLEATMKELARRTGLLELRIFVMAVSVHGQAGGNLSHLLDKMATVIRERYQIRGKVKSLTAEGRLQAAILLALPFVVMGALLVVSRGYAATLFNYPWLIGCTLGLEVIGALWMRQIINFDF
jgi:tight adherence protein B